MLGVVVVVDGVVSGGCRWVVSVLLAVLDGGGLRFGIDGDADGKVWVDSWDGNVCCAGQWACLGLGF